MREMLMKYLSRSSSVHEEHREDEDQKINNNGEGSVCETLTVWRKSLLISCNGFTVFDNSNGNLVYRVDNYILRPHEIILMDALGKSLLTLRRSCKKLSLVDSNNWLVYEGDVAINTKLSAIFQVRRIRNNTFQSNHHSNNVLAYVYRTSFDNKRHCDVAYVIDGSYVNRSCKIVDHKSRRVVAEIKRKEAIVGGGGISFGSDVFTLILHSAFDSAFAMALILLLDQMFS